MGLIYILEKDFGTVECLLSDHRHDQEICLLFKPGESKYTELLGRGLGYLSETDLIVVS